MVIISLILLPLVFVCPMLVLRPLINLGKHDNEQENLKRFSIVDLLSLVFLIQLAFIIPGSTQADLSDLPVIGIVMLFLLAVIIWCAGLRALNQIGVVDWRKRLVCVGFTFPVAIFGGFFSVITLSMIACGFIYPEDLDFSPRTKLLTVLAFVVTMLAAFLSAQWIAKNSASKPDKLSIHKSHDQ